MARKRRLPEGLTDEALDALARGVETPEQLDELFRGLKKALVERVLRAELTSTSATPRASGPSGWTMPGMARRPRRC